MASIRDVGEAIEEIGPDAAYVGLRNLAGSCEEDYRLWRTEPLTDLFGRLVGGRMRARLWEVGDRLLDMTQTDLVALGLAKRSAVDRYFLRAERGPRLRKADRVAELVANEGDALSMLVHSAPTISGTRRPTHAACRRRIANFRHRGSILR